MNRSILFALLAIVPTMAKAAQGPELRRQFLKEGKEWRCQMMEEHLMAYDAKTGMPVAEYDQHTQYGIIVGGDTLVDSRVYKKLYMATYSVERIDRETGMVTEQEVTEGNRMLCEGLMREEEEKVFLYHTSSKEEFVLHDFSLTVGQTGEMAGCPTTVERIDTILNNVSLYRRFYISLGADESESHGHILVEGIGCQMDPRFTYALQMNDGRHYGLISVYEDGQRIFTASDFYAEAYSLTDGITAINKSEKRQAQTYDLQGRRTEGTPRKGLYIRQGKKVLKGEGATEKIQ